MPDLTVWSESTQPLVVGEVKTPWTLNLLEVTGPGSLVRFMQSAGISVQSQLGFNFLAILTLRVVDRTSRRLHESASAQVRLPDDLQ